MQGYEVGRLGMLRYAPVMTNLGPWDVDTLAARLPAELGPDLQPPPMPWPEPPRADDAADEEMEIYIAEPDGDARGAVIVLQEAFGVNEHIRDICDRFAAAGYVAAAPHLFHRSGDPELGYDDMMAVVPYIMQLQADDLEADIDATLERLAQMGFAPGQVAAVGFCMGGTISFAAGCVWPLGAAVTFYGGGIAQGRFGLPPLLDLAPSLQCPWLGCFGDLDVSIPTVEVEGLREQSRRHRARHRDRAVPGREPRLPLRRPQLVPRGVGQGHVGAHARVPRRTPLTDLEIREALRDLVDGAAVELEVLAGDVRRRVGREEHRGVGDVLGRAHATHPACARPAADASPADATRAARAAPASPSRRA